jgi:hypothetical protein
MSWEQVSEPPDGGVGWIEGEDCNSCWTDGSISGSSIACTGLLRWNYTDLIQNGCVVNTPANLGSSELTAGYADILQDISDAIDAYVASHGGTNVRNVSYNVIETLFCGNSATYGALSYCVSGAITFQYS